MPHVITLLNQKGGVGKTSTCHHLAGTLALAGQRVLLVDNDPQASLTQGFWGPARTRGTDPAVTIAAVYSREAFPAQVVHQTTIQGIALLPGSKAAKRWNVPELDQAETHAQTALRDFIDEVRDQYEYILIDCAPTLYLCSWAALVACDALVIPLKPEDYASQGLFDVNEAANLVRNDANPALRTLGILLTMVSPKLSVHQLYEENLRAEYGPLVFNTRVNEATDYKEALNQRKPVAHHKPKGAAAKTMRALAQELADRLDQARPEQAQGKDAA
jgi:chromosome partitioning protein